MNKEQERERSGEKQYQIINFSVGTEEYGVDIHTMKEVIRIREITPLPKAPHFVKGVINLRGDVIPIIDLREKFGLEQREYTEATRVMVVEVEKRMIGLVVDSVSHVIRLGEGQIDPTPPLVGGVSSEYIRGVGKLDERLIVLLNIDRIITAEEKIELQKMDEKGVYSKTGKSETSE